MVSIVSPTTAVNSSRRASANSSSSFRHKALIPCLLLSLAMLRRIEQETVEQAPLLGGEPVVERRRVSPVLLRGDHPGVLVSVIEHDPRAVVLRPRAGRVPKRVV